MGRILGMDEAGYGPNLGPLAIGLTEWEVAGSPHGVDLYDSLAPVFSPVRSRDPGRIHVADSKQVYSPSRGIASLESPVLAILQACGIPCRDLQELLTQIAHESLPELREAPWFNDLQLPLPLAASPERIEQLADEIRNVLREREVRLVGVSCDLVGAQRFNRRLELAGTKGVALSQISLELLARHWNPTEHGDSLVIADKHGGRNRYDDLLADALGGLLVFRRDESRELSRYRVGRGEIVFQMKAEQHLPVALASMMAKYLRELAMELFNRFWQRHLPGLKPTKGYPVDARRYRDEIAQTQSSLGIPDSVLWRNR